MGFLLPPQSSAPDGEDAVSDTGDELPGSYGNSDVTPGDGD